MDDLFAPIVEIFTSIDGEVNWFGPGVLSRFIRLGGCNLSCSWCDTKKSQSRSFPKMNPVQVYGKIMESRFVKVTITGGEPLIHQEFVKRLVNLLVPNFCCTIETNGTIEIKDFMRPYVGWVVDDKPPSSGNAGLFRYNNVKGLGCTDYIKMVIHTKEDLEWAIEETFYLSSIGCRAEIAWGCTPDGEVKPSHIIPVLQKHCLEYVRLNFQSHKLLNLQ